MLKQFCLLSALTSMALASPLEVSKISTKADPEYPKFETVPKFRGACPILSGTPKWNPATYVSRNWWQPIASPFFWNFPGTTCISATYQPTGQLTSTGGVYFSVLNQGILPPQKQEKYGTEYEVANGQAVVNTAYNGTASVIFYNGTPDPEGTNYVVIDTDNETFAYVWYAATYGKRTKKCRPILWLFLSDRNASDGTIKYHAEQAAGIIKSSGWRYADQFAESFEYWQTRGCPDVPNSPYDN